MNLKLRKTVTIKIKAKDSDAQNADAKLYSFKLPEVAARDVAIGLSGLSKRCRKIKFSS